MKINGSSNVSSDLVALAARAAREVSQTPTPKNSTVAQAAPQPRKDSVEFSAEGRALASLSPERSQQIRQNILQGAYDATHVIEQVAKRILKSGDI